jgi:hypothetical protein
MCEAWFVVGCVDGGEHEARFEQRRVKFGRGCRVDLVAQRSSPGWLARRSHATLISIEGLID